MNTLCLPFDKIARLPAPEDNVAIATHRLEVGTKVGMATARWPLSHTILEGHRFAIRPIATGQPLLSWGFPFGVAVTDIAAGDYVCNQSMLNALAVRKVDGARIPSQPNFSDLLTTFTLDEIQFRPGPEVSRLKHPGTFSGFRRPGKRGVGTRNYIVILGTTSRTGSFARQLATRLQPLARVFPSVDGILPIAHTEGGGNSEPHNATEVLRTLAGFMVHPNVAAVLALDFGVEPISNARLQRFMEENRYPLKDIPHQFITLNNGLAAGLAAGERIVRCWLPEIALLQRTVEPISELRIALQCGGSDAFSGVSGNPLAGSIVHELIRHGCSAVMTETDEAVGAEGYMLDNVRDISTARAFLSAIDQFKTYLSWHGVDCESNPSGGNKFRGLYNIALKSLGAVHKKDPRTRLEAVIGYAQPLREVLEPGFIFMNGPGNDLEGIAGQVAAGCNLILFVTGNGSITNFPFVPTLKITTTTRRHNLLIHEMDINAGRYLDGEPMQTLATEYVALTLQTASGRKTKGEHAGHSQVSLWRNWPQIDQTQLSELCKRGMPDGVPLQCPPTLPSSSGRPSLQAFLTETGFATELIGLILPTSLCSGQIARLAAQRMNEKQLWRAKGISRFEALTHTEGCGSSGESLFRLLARSYHGYLTHPNVAAALLLEHGCEKTTNDVIREGLEAAGLDTGRFGWASVQLDGGIAKVLDKIEAWFAQKLSVLPPAPRVSVDLGALSVGLMTAAPVSQPVAASLAILAGKIIGSGGTILVPESDALLANASFCTKVLGTSVPHSTLAYGQHLTTPGFHIVASETDHWLENLTGLGACGAHLVLGVVADHARQGHPLLPVLQIAEASQHLEITVEDIDLFLSGDISQNSAALEQLLISAAELKHRPVANANGMVDFQFTRGLLGVTS